MDEERSEDALAGSSLDFSDGERSRYLMVNKGTDSQDSNGGFTLTNGAKLELMVRRYSVYNVCKDVTQCCRSLTGWFDW